MSSQYLTNQLLPLWKMYPFCSLMALHFRARWLSSRVLCLGPSTSVTIPRRCSVLPALEPFSGQSIAATSADGRLAWLPLRLLFTVPLLLPCSRLCVGC